jgi:Putative Ig domain
VTAVLGMGVAALALGASAAPAPPHVTVIGDSVLTAVEWNDAPLAALQKGLDVYMDIGVCRTVAGVSCPYEGGRVPTLLDVIAGMGVRLGPTVLVEVGYNDDPATFGKNVDAAVQAMLRVGVQRILWVNMPASSQHWVDLDNALDTVAKHYGQMTIVDWDHFSHEHWSWFQGDGIHLVYPGAVAMAGLLNQALVQATAPPPAPLRPVATQLPPAVVGKQYSTHLAAESGTAPYRWRSTSGALPRGLHLLADGTITGVPRRVARARLVLQVTDARGSVATVRETLVVVASPSGTSLATH